MEDLALLGVPLQNPTMLSRLLGPAASPVTWKGVPGIKIRKNCQVGKSTPTLCLLRFQCVVRLGICCLFAFLVRIESLESVEFSATCLVSKIAGEAEMT